MKKVKIFSVILAITMFMCTGFSKSSFKALGTDSQPDTYQYCPDSINDKVYYCYGNTYNVHDTIHMFDTKSKKDYLVLAPLTTSWDSYHVCDPEVIEGNFKYRGINYKYLMAYLGCDNGENKNNKIGLAVSTEGRGWIRVGDKPLKLYNDETELGNWGMGQPSIIRTKDKNRYILFYTKENNNLTQFKEFYRFIDFSNLDNLINEPNKYMSDEQAVGTNGLPQGRKIQNADFARCGEDVYMVCDDTKKFKHKYNGKSIKYPTPDTSLIYKAVPGENDNFFKIEWKKVAKISPENGYERNHNCCFKTNGYSELVGKYVYCTGSSNSTNYEEIEYNKDPAVLTKEKMNENTSFHEVLETYRIYGVKFK